MKNGNISKPKSYYSLNPSTYILYEDYSSFENSFIEILSSYELMSLK